jgi:hypothetical protein
MTGAAFVVLRAGNASVEAAAGGGGGFTVTLLTNKNMKKVG